MKIYLWSPKIDGYEYVFLQNESEENLKKFNDLSRGELGDFASVDFSVYDNEPVRKFKKSKNVKRTDFPFMRSLFGGYIFSEKALEITKEFLCESAGTIKLEEVEGEKYYIVIVTNILDALDYDNCAIDRMSNGKAFDISQFAFIKSVVENHDIFKVTLEDHIYASAVFVSEKFKNKIESSGLNGHKFIEVWEENKEPFEYPLW